MGVLLSTKQNEPLSYNIKIHNRQTEPVRVIRENKIVEKFNWE